MICEYWYLRAMVTFPNSFDSLHRLWSIQQQVQEKRKEDEAKLISQTRRALRLKRLIRDPRLAAKDFHSACQRLLFQAEAISHVLDGCSVRIGFATRMASDGSYIEIAHDFRD